MRKLSAHYAISALWKAENRNCEMHLCSCKLASLFKALSLFDSTSSETYVHYLVIYTANDLRRRTKQYEKIVPITAVFAESVSEKSIILSALTIMVRENLTVRIN